MEEFFLKQLSLLNFKNYAEAKLILSEKINCFTGKNGIGKTNLLDAIHYLSVSKSYFNPLDAQNIKHGEEFFMIEGDFEKNQMPEKVYLALKKGQKKLLKRNDKEYIRLADHIGVFPLVMISPADRNLILEGSETRRKFMDGVISQSDRVYLDDLINYQKVLQQRNALLKYFAANRTFDRTSLEVYDEQLCHFGKKIHQKRQSFVDEMRPILLKYYNVLCNGEEEVALKYSSQLDERAMPEILVANLEKDRAMQYTTGGAHKDDLKFLLEKHSLKKTGSQGQQKSFLVALKLAQFDFIKKQTGTKPILLLDDIFDKLDEHRVRALVELVSSPHFGQIFITDTHAERTEMLAKAVDQQTRLFRVEENQHIYEAG